MFAEFLHDFELDLERFPVLAKSAFSQAFECLENFE